MTDHERQLERLEDFLDDALPPAERDAFAAHLEDCPECRAEAESHHRLVRMAAAAEPVRIPDDLSSRVRERIESSAGGPRRDVLRPLFWAAGVAAAVAQKEVVVAAAVAQKAAVVVGAAVVVLLPTLIRALLRFPTRPRKSPTARHAIVCASSTRGLRERCWGTSMRPQRS